MLALGLAYPRQCFGGVKQRLEQMRNRVLEAVAREPQRDQRPSGREPESSRQGVDAGEDEHAGEDGRPLQWRKAERPAALDPQKPFLVCTDDCRTVNMPSGAPMRVSVSFSSTLNIVASLQVQVANAMPQPVPARVR